ncbi:CD164 sialomucin-like 2 protein [Cheilinus undulatus]|uniref:CD164 sialomucin-like 2 protein n=1 Tax=Cheilinus undulatus TaxID=241271 RepID=UPI001BD5C541|nr:CD164 sialomucin-like 2 protein [Cheilinus undulatus]
MVARTPGFGVAHVTQISVSPVFPSVSQPGVISLFATTGCPLEELYWEITSSSIKVSRCKLQVIRMQKHMLKVLCSALLLLAVMPSVYSQSDCSQAQSCDLCVGDSMLNLTGCIWRLCPTGNDTGMCVADQGDSVDLAMNCSWTRLSELCTGIRKHTLKSTQNVYVQPDSSLFFISFSQAKFDMSSFIGGIILVLCVQAGGFFAMRFLKSKEQSSYDPIDQPAQ